MSLIRTRLIILVPSILLSFYSMSQDKWEEVRFDNEVVIVKDIGIQNEKGYVIAQNSETVNIIVADDLKKVGEIAFNDLKRYLQLACQSKVKVLTEKDKESIDGKNVIILAQKASKDLLKWSGLDDKVNNNIREQECLIIPTKIKNINGIVLIGGSKRGLLNGVYSFLEKSSMDIHWYPPRIYYNKEELFPAETFLIKADKITWNEGEIHWKPALIDNISHGNFSKKFIDWASRNRMNIYIARPSPRDMTASEKQREAVDYAHELGIKVLFLGMTHRLHNDITNIPHSSDTALAMSTKLYADMFKEYNIDGMAWHTASESITLNMDEEYRKKTRIEWESIYLNSYEKAIREIKEDAILGMLMGWVYMDPADEIAKYVNKNIVSWIVPRTPIIDAAVADIDVSENDINKMIDETKSLFSDHYFGIENDFFWEELVKLADQQVKEISMNK